MRFSNFFVSQKTFFLYLLRFIGAFLVLYLGSKVIIGLAAPGNYYSPFVEAYLNYPAWLRHSLLYGAKFFLSIGGVDSYILDGYYLRMPGGKGIHMVYSCLGLGVLSFWAAFIFANKSSIGRKIAWIIFGFFLIWLINVARISILFVLTNKNTSASLPVDHHTFFNIAAYLLIFLLIWRYDASSKAAAA